jgi:hypothetical protein
MGFQQEVDKVEQVVYLPVVLIVLGGLVTLVTVWKGVHGFWPSIGILVGGLLLVVGAFFKRIYK